MIPNKQNKTKHLTFRISEAFASAIDRYIQNSKYENKSVMLRELFNKEVKKSNLTEVQHESVEDER